MGELDLHLGGRPDEILAGPGAAGHVLARLQPAGPVGARVGQPLDQPDHVAGRVGGRGLDHLPSTSSRTVSRAKSMPCQSAAGAP